MLIKTFAGNLVISLTNVSFIEDVHKPETIKLSAKSLFKVKFCFPTKYSSRRRKELLNTK